jgi:hypothetical protein
MSLTKLRNSSLYLHKITVKTNKIWKIEKNAFLKRALHCVRYISKQRYRFTAVAPQRLSDVLTGCEATKQRKIRNKRLASNKASADPQQTFATQRNSYLPFIKFCYVHL